MQKSNLIPICTTLDQLRINDGQIASIEGVLKAPISKKFPSIIYLMDGASVAFILSEKFIIRKENMRKYFDKKVIMTGRIYVKNLPNDIESHLDLPYVLDVEEVKENI